MGRFFIENSRRGGGSPGRGGAEGPVSAVNSGIGGREGGRGAKFFFSGPKCPSRRGDFAPKCFVFQKVAGN